MAAADLEKCAFMGNDFKNEISIVRLINDMVMVSKTLYKQISRYNHFDSRAKLLSPDPINFPSLFELQKIYQTKDSASEKSDDIKSAA